MLIDEKKQVKFGAILSYALIVLNFLYGMIITPYILKSLGSSEYGVYKTIASFSNSLMVLDFGISTTVMRYVAKYKAEKDNKSIENFAAMSIIQVAVICIVIVIASAVMYIFIEPTYKASMSAEQIVMAEKIFIILSVTLCAKILENVLFGLISGYNRFVFANGAKTLLIASRAVLLVMLLNFWKSAYIITFIDLFITVVMILLQLIYIRKNLNLNIKLYKWENSVFIESFKYTALMFLQSIVIQINGNLDNIVIGAVVSPDAVAVYSFGIMMFGMYESLATSFSNLMLV